MKLRLAACAALAAGAVADQSVLVDDVDSASSKASSASVALPTFTPTSLKAPFLEQFTDGWDKRWKASHAKKETGPDAEEWAYVGEWAAEEPHVLPGMVGDKGLVVKNPAAHHAISAKFPKKLDTKSKPLVVQYEVKLQNGLECGGAYLKLLRDQKSLHQEEFSNASPYVIMFGPDKCGHTNKVHFIFNHKNPKTGKYEEKHLAQPPTANIVKTTELYTLIVHPNNSFAILQNNVESHAGSLLESFQPAVNPPAEIDDPKDSKPDDWVDEPSIPDPDATKPDDWDEDAPFEVEDAEATIPDDWLVDEPTTVPDPEAAKPDDWDDDEDGDWIAPSAPNPKCAEVSGCGPWKRPSKKNPDYKGKWSAPVIENPAYKGVWAPRKIKNPDFFEDKAPANFEPMGAIGFEIWTMQSDILFDNIYIGHSIADAKKLAAETWEVKHAVEVAAEEVQRPKFDEDARTGLTTSFKDDPVLYIKQKVNDFLRIAKADPLAAVQEMPDVAAAGASVLVVLLTIVFGALLGGGGGGAAAAAAKDTAQKAAAKGKKAAAADVKAKAKDADDKATASGTDKEGKEKEATKRSTRSQS